ncbi:rRNA maturation RNase YbeY [Chachezhania antarctica]|uniref:rRNA maturation RNase YbeY n=1 Tax=Chachezhania antarctica TaxID=2340860 RepID=UPI000EB17975|nr:rRNA maturation RNase YbeY [Chachezhania antarctica]|tara:strand:+ start:4880 stop:5380 length:501 start_codon:yes stop_codon:yes gene_type:complete
MVTDVRLEDPRWESCDLDGLCERAAIAVCAWAGLDPDLVEITVLGCDDARIAVLNAEFREKPQPTNVLSWPEEDLSSDTPGAVPEAPETNFEGVYALGDIAIAWETCEAEARAANKPVQDHATHLIVHAVLHLLGYDHICNEDANLMETAEVEILGHLGLENPYSD